jgi:uncharacterized damage-inducible protein DinB
MTRELLASIDEAYNRRSWHGTNLRGSIRGVDLETAARRPKAGRHNIWELVVHAAYWKYDIRRRLTGEKPGSFALEGSNFWKRPDVDLDGETAWKRDIALLDAEHKRLRGAVEAFPKSRWTQKAPGKPFTFAGLVRGVAAHDLYHAGQIQVLKTLFS